MLSRLSTENKPFIQYTFALKWENYFASDILCILEKKYIPGLMKYQKQSSELLKSTTPFPNDVISD